MDESVREVPMAKSSSFVYKALIEWDQVELMGRLRYEVYCQQRHLLCSSDYPEGIELDDDDLRSIHIGVFTDSEDDADSMVGCMRLILGGEVGHLPCESNFELRQRAPEDKRSCELSRLIVAREMRRRSKEIVLGLVRSAYRCCIGLELAFCYAVVEKPLLIFLRGLGLQFKEIGDEKWYYNTANVPTLLETASVETISAFDQSWYEPTLSEKAIIARKCLDVRANTS